MKHLPLAWSAACLVLGILSGLLLLAHAWAYAVIWLLISAVASISVICRTTSTVERYVALGLLVPGVVLLVMFCMYGLSVTEF